MLRIDGEQARDAFRGTEQIHDLRLFSGVFRAFRAKLRKRTRNWKRLSAKPFRRRTSQRAVQASVASAASVAGCRVAARGFLRTPFRPVGRPVKMQWNACAEP
jgi:hypothetical protein